MFFCSAASGSQACWRCVELSLACILQVSKPSTRACQACFISKQQCSWGEDATVPAAVGVRESASQVIAPRGCSHGGARDVQLCAVKAAEDSALAHKRSVGKLGCTATAAERAAMALEGIQLLLQENAQLVLPHPPVPSRPPIIPTCDLPMHSLTHPSQAMLSGSSDRQSARCPEYHPAKWGCPGTDNMEDAEASTEVDEGLTEEMEMS